MSVVFDAASTADTTGAAATSFSNATNMTVGTSANVLVVLIAWSSTAPTGISITWNGVALTQVAGAAHANGTAGNTDIWALVNPASGTKTLAGSWTGSRDFYVAALSYSGADSSSVASAVINGNFAVTTSNSLSDSVITHNGNANVAVGAAAGTISSVTSGTQVFLDNTQTAKAVGIRLTGSGSNQNFTASLAASVAWVISVAEVAQAPPFVNSINDYSNGWGRNDLPVPEQAYNQNLYRVVIPLPNNQYDYPRPFRVRRSPYDLSVSLNPNLFKNNVPVSNINDYSNRWGRNDLTVPEQPYNQNLYQVTVQSEPRAPYVTKLPPFPYGVPQPQPYNQNLYGVTAQVTLPFNQTDFPKVFDIRQAPFFPHEALNPNTFTNPYPFNQYDYRKPVKVPQAPIPPDTLNINLFNNSYPIQNVTGLVAGFGVADFPVSQQPYNQNLYSITTVQSQPRVPYVTKLPSFPYVPPQPQPYNQNLYSIVVQPLPFNQTDFPKVFDIRQAPFSPDQQFNINLFTNPFPFNQYDYLKPVKVPQAPIDLSFRLNQNLTNFFPFNQFDYLKPIKVPQAPIVVDQALNINLFTNPYPFNQYDYLKPLKVPQATVNPDQWLNINVFSNSYPLNQYDWSKPVRIKQATFVPTDPVNINLFTNQYPFNQVDWSKPIKLPQAPYSPTDPLNINLFTNPFPVLNLDLDTQVRQRPIVDSTQPYNVNLYGVVVVTVPFNQVDFARPFVPRPAPLLDPPLNPNIFTNLYPFTQTDWSKPFKAPKAPFFPHEALNPNIFTNLYPFNQYDYLKANRTPQAPVNPDQALNANLFAVVPLPFIPIDWNKPFVPKFPPTIDQALNVNLFTNPVPVLNLDLFTPIRTKGFPDTSQAYNVNLYGVVVVQVPFNQVDWTKPFVPRPAPMRDQLFNPNVFTNPLPFNQFDFNIKPLRTPQAPVNPDQWLNINLFTNQYPFLNVFGLSTKVAGLVPPPQPYNQNIYTVVVTVLPFNTYDYPRALRLPRAAYDVSVQINPNLFTNPFPFNQYDWAKAVRVKNVHSQPPYNQGLYNVVVTATLHVVKFIGNVGSMLVR